MTTEVISQLEARLRQAQLASDTAALDDLISDDLQFVFYDGAVFTKQMDLQAHRSGAIRIRTLDFSEQSVRCLGEVAVVTVRAKMAGTFLGEPFEGSYRYLRTWALRGSRWQIIAGSVSQVAA